MYYFVYIMYMYYMYNFIIHSSADVHLGCFHVLAIINSAAMNTGAHVTLSILVLRRWYLSLDLKNDEEAARQGVRNGGGEG